MCSHTKIHASPKLVETGQNGVELIPKSKCCRNQDGIGALHNCMFYPSSVELGFRLARVPQNLLVDISGDLGEVLDHVSKD